MYKWFLWNGVVIALGIFVGSALPSCTEQHPSQPVQLPAPGLPPKPPVEVIDPSGSVSIEMHGATNYSVVSKGKRMAVVAWKVVISNTSTKHAQMLEVFWLDANGKIVAKDHKHVNVLPGKLLEQTGTTDIPVDALEATKTMNAKLVIED